jgi:hypothetical protein
MLPQSHVSYTVAAVDLLKERIPALKKVDYRLIALAATGPDLLDKPLAALYFYRKYKSAVLFAHTLIVHLGLFLFTVWKKPRWWPYALAFNGHAVLDRLGDPVQVDMARDDLIGIMGKTEGQFLRQ